MKSNIYISTLQNNVELLKKYILDDSCYYSKKIIFNESNKKKEEFFNDNFKIGDLYYLLSAIIISFNPSENIVINYNNFIFTENIQNKEINGIIYFYTRIKTNEIIIVFKNKDLKMIAIKNKNLIYKLFIFDNYTFFQNEYNDFFTFLTNKICKFNINEKQEIQFLNIFFTSFLDAGYLSITNECLYFDDIIISFLPKSIVLKYNDNKYIIDANKSLEIT